MLTLLPSSGAVYSPTREVVPPQQPPLVASNDQPNVAGGHTVLLLQSLLRILVSDAGFHIPKVIGYLMNELETVFKIFTLYITLSSLLKS